MRIVNVEVNYPDDCPYRQDGRCKKLSHGNWEFKCDERWEFPKECPLSEFGFLQSDAGLEAAINLLRDHCNLMSSKGIGCDGCKLNWICQSGKKFRQEEV